MFYNICGQNLRGDTMKDQPLSNTERIETFPPLREDLILNPGPLAKNGTPTWTIHDPASNHFFRIGWSTFEILSRWQLGTARAIAAAVTTQTTLNISATDVEALYRHLAHCMLFQVTGRTGLAFLTQKARGARTNMGKRLLENYLFFRIPLIHPDRLLTHLLPWLRWVFSQGFLAVVLISALAGLLFIFRQWDYFTTTLVHSLATGDILPYGIALVLSKSLHELGHALTAKHFGCRVPVMGVAILVLWPVLYTEASDVWKLPSRRQRLAVGAAGVLAELALAAIATLAWSFLDDGPIRNAAFFLATVTWILTLIINLNPLMRFDGYYLLSDFLETVNLQARSFALGRWSLRETLFALQEPPPEQLPTQQQRFLILFALTTWIYRFFLFLSIALLVYQFFFKILGLFLFIVEVYWFLVRPIFTEISFWIRRLLKPSAQQGMPVNGHILVTGMVLLTLLTALFLPWLHSIEAPATLRAVRHTYLFPPQAARLETPLPALGQQVSNGDILLRLHLPALDHQEARIQREIELLRWQMAASRQDKKLLEQRQALQEQLVARFTELTATHKEQSRLIMTAPFSAVVVNRLEAINPGEWVAEGEALLSLVDPNNQMVEAFVAGDYPGIDHHTQATFYPENPDIPPLPCRLLTLDQVNIQRLRNAELASRYGGPILVREEHTEELIPREAYFRLTLIPQTTPPPLTQIVRGTATISIPAESPASRLWQLFSSLLLRESGF